MLQKQIGETIAKGLQEFVNPFKLTKFRKEIHIQMKELEGLQQFEQGLYHNNHYENFMKNLVNTRKQFRTELSLQSRQAVATNEYSFWRKYIQERTSELPEDNKITETTLQQLQQSFDIACERNQTELPVLKLPKMHYDHTRMFHFNLPIDNRFILQMIHFHMGYLLRLQRPITFNELLQIYNIKILATYEKSLGQDLLGQELSSYAYWSLFDKEGLGYMNIRDFASFMNIFKFTLDPNLKSIKREFEFASNLFQGEFIKSIDENQDIVRFDFFRYIFLERNL